MSEQESAALPAVVDPSMRPSGRSGLPAPVEHRYKPGRSGNPAGWTKEQSRLQKLIKKELRKLNPDGSSVADGLMSAIVRRTVAEAEAEPGSRAPLLIAMLDRLLPAGSPERSSLAQHLSNTTVTLNLAGHDVTTGAHCPTCTCPRHASTDPDALMPPSAAAPESA